jgi:putative redox protein
LSGTRADEHEYAPWRAVWRRGLATDVSGRGHTIRVDEPPESGGEDTGPMPTEVLAAALASCMCISVAWAAKKRRVEIADVAVEVRMHRAPGEPRHGRYEVRVESSLPHDVLAPIVALGARYCWVTNTLKNPPEITYEVVATG